MTVVSMWVWVWVRVFDGQCMIWCCRGIQCTALSSRLNEASRKKSEQKGPVKKAAVVAPSKQRQEIPDHHSKKILI